LRTIATILLLVLLAAAGWLAWALLLPVQPAGQRFVLLRPGLSSRSIAGELESQGVIRSARAFLLYHFAATPGTSLKAGEYQFDLAASAVQVHGRLVRGDVFKRTVTIPEGYNMFEIAAAVEAAGLGPRQDFLRVARHELSLVADLDPQATSLEGYLFPDTYQFTRTQTMTDIAAVMVRRFRQEGRALGLLPGAGEPGRAAATEAFDLHRVVTMASIVEKETAVADERPVVASVYGNRLARKMALSADPTVIYAALLAERFKGGIYQSDLQSDSPYNTYRFAGLPPGPIANPGRASLRAAMHPAQTDYYYFVSDANGHHRFARTLDEQNHNVRLYRRALAAARR
jgi:UPF0755 protein